MLSEYSCIRTRRVPLPLICFLGLVLEGHSLKSTAAKTSAYPFGKRVEGIHASLQPTCHGNWDIISKRYHVRPVSMPFE
ncbi:hypothetical protein DFS33DRAFT_691287 [Desarmillaria ectypa]|nr:hypothetical protein DFS33DRAFT_691287 [Desarmillaria ectypa]